MSPPQESPVLSPGRVKRSGACCPHSEPGARFVGRKEAFLSTTNTRNTRNTRALFPARDHTIPPPSPAQEPAPGVDRGVRQRTPSAEELNERRLVGILSAGQGYAPREALLDGGFTPDRLAELVEEGVLAVAPEASPGSEAPTASAGAYRFVEPLDYLPEIVWVAWRVPGAIIGGLSAAIYHALTVSSPRVIEITIADTAVAVAQPTEPTEPSFLLDELPVRVLPVPPWRRTYGVEQGAPLGGSPEVRIPLYSRPVAVAQVLATPDHGMETLIDCVMMYVGARGVAAPLQEAVTRYGVESTLRQALTALDWESPSSRVARL